MRLNFRHGLVRYQTDGANHPIFLQKNGSYIDMYVFPDPTVFTIAHFDQNYLFTENVTVNHAWGPFVVGTNYWLYWDIDLLTGQLTRSYTLVDPVFQTNEPASPTQDQHWYDKTNFVMKVREGSRWVEKLRCFAAKYQNGTTIIPYSLGTQIGISNVITHAGFPLFDDANLPIQRFRKDRKGVFIHTEMPLASQWSRLSNFVVGAAIIQATATENIDVYQPVAYTGPNKIGLAKTITPNQPAIGIASENMVPGEIRSFITSGYVENENWNWDVGDTEPAGTPIFVSSTGTLTTSPPQSFSIQQIASVVDKKVILVDIKPLIHYG